MYVCLCTGATSQAVGAAIAGGAATCKQVAAACGAGIDCGRCRPTVRDIIAAHGERACATLSRTQCQVGAVSPNARG